MNGRSHMHHNIMPHGHGVLIDCWRSSVLLLVDVAVLIMMVSSRRPQFHSGRHRP